MNKFVVPQAEGIKYLEIRTEKDRFLGSPFGGKPKSIRKKGFWRACRAGKLCALVSPQTFLNLPNLELKFKRVYPDIYIQPNTMYLFWSKDE